MISLVAFIESDTEEDAGPIAWMLQLHMQCDWESEQWRSTTASDR
jgi:hypothetical protein